MSTGTTSFGPMYPMIPHMMVILFHWRRGPTPAANSR